MLENVERAFGSTANLCDEAHVKELHAKIGQLTLENDFLSKVLGLLDQAQRTKKVGRSNKFSLTRQCELLDMNRSGLCYCGFKYEI